MPPFTNIVRSISCRDSGYDLDSDEGIGKGMIREQWSLPAPRALRVPEVGLFIAHDGGCARVVRSLVLTGAHLQPL